MSAFRPITPPGLVDVVAGSAFAMPGHRIVAIDAHPVANPVAVAEDVASTLRTRGRGAGVVHLDDFIRPASQRMEYGHQDPHSYQHAWFDYAAIDREVITALHERGEWLPRLWDIDNDRSFRDAPLAATSDHVVVIAGPMLRDRGLSLDLTVELSMSTAAINRRIADDLRWQTAPFIAYQAGVTEAAHIVVRYEHPDRPAVRTD